MYLIPYYLKNYLMVSKKLELSAPVTSDKSIGLMMAFLSHRYERYSTNLSIWKMSFVGWLVGLSLSWTWLWAPFQWNSKKANLCYWDFQILTPDCANVSTSTETLLLFNLPGCHAFVPCPCMAFSGLWLTFAYFSTSRCVGYLDSLQIRGCNILTRKELAGCQLGF